MGWGQTRVGLFILDPLRSLLMLAGKTSQPGNRRSCVQSPDAAPAWLRVDPAGGIEYVHHPTFSLPGAQQRLWPVPDPPVAMQPFRLLPVIDVDSQPRPIPHPALRRDAEKRLFLRYNFAKYRISKILRLPARRRGRKAELALWVRRVQQTRRQLVDANLPLVPSMARKMLHSGAEFEELVSEGYLAVLRSIEKFDVSRGYKFSTYTCRSIFSSFLRVMRKNRTLRRYEPVYYDPALEPSDECDRRHEQQRAYAIETVQRLFEANTMGLSPTERNVMTRRFGMDCPAAQTLKQVAGGLGLSTERVRQIERSCLAKIRVALRECGAA